MRRPPLLLACSAVAGILSTGCDTPATDGTAKPVFAGEPMQVRQPFPSQARVEALSMRTVDQPLAVVGTLVPVSSWSIDPAVPDHDWRAPYRGDEPNAAAFAAWVDETTPQVVASASATCVAQQYAKFRAQHADGVTSDDILTFVHARCGLPFDDVRASLWSFQAQDFRPLQPDAPQPKVLETLEGLSEGSIVGLGVWTEGNLTVAAVVSTEPKVLLEPIAFDTATSGMVRVTGTYVHPTEWLHAVVTDGPLGAKVCTRIPVSGPTGSFGFECPTNTSDPAGLIELSAAPKGSVVGSTLARLFISPDGSLPTTYEASSIDLPATEADFSSSAVLAGINALRTRAGLGDVLGAPEQDGESANLFPLLQGSTEPGVRNEAGLGAMAGWHISETIRSARFETTFAPADATLSGLLGGALLFPSFRSVILHPQTRRLSIATLESPGARGLMAVAYEVFEPGDFAAEEKAVFDALDDARAKADLPPVTRVEGGVDEDALAKSADRIRTGASTPRAELDRMLAYFQDKVKRDFYGVIYAPTRIEGWTPDFSDDFFEHEDIAVATTVSYFEPPGAAWGQHVVFMVFTPL